MSSSSIRTTRSRTKRRKTTTTTICDGDDLETPASCLQTPGAVKETPMTVTPDILRKRILANQNKKLDCQVIHLNDSQTSWLLLVKEWFPCPDQATFDKEWNLHPPERHLLKIFGRVVPEKRWSQSWGVSYAYSGATNPGRPIPPNSRVAHLLSTVNDLVQNDNDNDNDESPYNACLQNWYEPDDTIGRHADDERDMRKELPIFSLSWGGTRRFLLRAKANTATEKTEIFLNNGDLLVMGGTTQETHYHEVPKRRVTMDPPTSRRINWTLRAFRETNTTSKKDVR